MSKNENYTNKSRCEKINESQLRKLIAESVREALLEAYSDSQYAHLAGQAHGALNSFGGRVKGLLNPEWKKRKERQRKKFADQATGNPFNRYSSTEGGENNYGRSKVNMGEYNPNSYDFIENDFDADGASNGKPFAMKRAQASKVLNDKGYRDYQNGPRNGEAYSNNDIRDMEPDDFKGSQPYWNLRSGNQDLNTNFNRGVKSVKGKDVKNGRGTFKNTTGTKGEYFRDLK